MKEKAENTVVLLKKAHNSKLKTAHLRKMIRKKVDCVNRELLSYYRAKNDKRETDAAWARDELSALLNRDASYTMILRSLLHPTDVEELPGLLD